MQEIWRSNDLPASLETDALEQHNLSTRTELEAWLRRKKHDRQAALLVEDAAKDDDEFTDTVWVQYETVDNARHAKVRGVQKPFYGNRLYISYAPHFESREDTADKLAQRRALLLRRARSSAKPVELIRHSMRQTSWTPSIPSSHSHVAAQDKTEFIGPQLPSRF
ncbi:hypothetical protein PsorP6_003077 [Peronosclerospora sorghi]|uniref:Uncharacterized protein n=1 Tax=Peronosclerospora sorghi TaxID=230839 RepID=A0ACC0VMV4_9STRA|nr:hypothetical protein PsorP6_003077 [Peronosclerospora sorghi]